MGHSQFKASKKWIQSFKERNAVVSRKVTKIVSGSDIRNMEVVGTSANDFIQRFRPNFHIYGEKNIYNTDQSGFNIELLSNRTLENKGSSKVEIRIEQQHSATHSYTYHFC